jgi:hypothetical protein
MWLLKGFVWGPKNVYTQNNRPPPPPPDSKIRAPHSAYASGENMKCSDGSDGNRENLPFWRPGRSRQYWTLKSTYQPDFFF